MTFNTVLTKNIINIPSPFNAAGINNRIHNNMTFGCRCMTSSIVTIFLIDHKYEQKIRMSFSILSFEFLYQCFMLIFIDMTD